MKAINLSQVITFFNQRKPLDSPQELRDWYVARPRSPRQYLYDALLNAQQTNAITKILFVGHRGSGKSTELHKLTTELTEHFETINFDVQDVLGRSRLGYQDVMLALITQTTKQCIAKDLLMTPAAEHLRDTWQGLGDWWLKLVSGLDFQSASSEITTTAGLQTLVGDIELGIKRSPHTYEQVMDQVEQQMSELIRRLNIVIAEAEKKLAPRRLLLIVEGLDKVDLESARNIFHEHGSSILAPEAAQIYTYPLALRLSPDFQNVRMSYSEHKPLHNLATHHADGSRHEAGFAALKSLALKRMNAELIDEEALALLIDNSGGVVVHLISLIRSAALYAKGREAAVEKIIVVDAQSAIRDLSDDLSINLRVADWRLLQQRHEDHRVSNEKQMQRLFYTGALVEYTNNRPWCDLHPALWSLLDYYRDG